MAEKTSYWIEFIGDRSVRVDEGQSILEAALQAGIPHYHACGGNAQCSTCRILVRDGVEYLNEPNEAEKALKTNIPLPPNVRLACQTQVQGSPVRIRRMIRDETDIALYIDDNGDELAPEIGKEQQLALFFLDIRNFTPFIEAYLPFDVIHIMRRLFTFFRRCIECCDGSIIETAGDGFYAVFGLNHNDLAAATSHAVQAGFSILEEIERFNKQYLEVHFNHQFEIGIGVHVGKVIVGNIGIGINDHLSVMGLPVNIASRLQAATRKLNNTFIVSDDVVRLLAEKPQSETTTIRLKGLTGNFKVHLLGKPFSNQ